MNRSFYLQLFVSMVALTTVTLLWVIPAEAQFNEQINYQGRLLDSTGSAVADGTYAMSFRLYTVATSGSAIWTETLSGASEVTVIDGLFSVMLGSTTPLSSVDFNQTLYLGVTIEADSEMAPRKILGAVPAAFVAKEADNANTVGGVASTSLMRNDQTGTVNASSSSSILSVIQNGLGKIASFFSGATEVFTILNNGNVGIGTSTPSSRLSVVGNAVIGGNLTATGTLTVGSLTGLLLGTNGTVSAISTSTLNLDLANTVGTLGATRGGTGLSTITQHQLLIGGAGNTWTQVSTSSLGLAGLSDLAAYLPLVGGSLTGNLTLSGSVANIVLGNNWLSGDGGDEGVFVSSTGLVGIGTSTPSNKLDIWGSVQIGTSSTPTLLVDTTNRQLIIGATTTTNPSAGIYMHDREFTIDNSGHAGTYSIGAEPSGVLAFYATGGNMEFRRNGINGLQLTSTGITINPNNSNSMDFIIDGDVSNNLLFADVSTENIGIGTSSPSSKLTVAGTAKVTGTTTLATTTVTDLTITYALRDAGGSAGTSGMVLQSTGTSTRWVATSTLGITGGGGSSALSGLSDVSLSGLATGQLLSYNGSVWNNISTSSLGLSSSFTNSIQLANLLSDETGTAGSVVFSVNPTFTGTADFANLIASQATVTSATTTNLAITSLTSGRIPVVTAGGVLFDTSALTFSGNILTITGSTTASNGYFIGTSTAIMGSTTHNAYYMAGATHMNGIDGMFQDYDLAIGVGALYRSGGGYENIAIGRNAAYGTTTAASDGYNNIAIGSNALANMGVGSDNVAIGRLSLYKNNGEYNIALGTYALENNTDGFNNIALGLGALRSNTDGGWNIAIGDGAGSNLIMGDKNIAIGYDVDFASTTASNQLNIGNIIYGTAIDGTGTTSSTGNVGIGTSSPSSKLTVVGTAEVTGTTTLATTTVTNLTLTGAFRDATNSAGTSGMVLQSTGTSTRWVATSTLGITGGGGSSALSGLSDVSLSGLATGQLLSYNGSVWNNVATSSLGLGNGTFLGLSDTPSAYTANRIMFTNSGATALTDSANLLFDGSQLATLNLAVSGTSTFSGTTTMASTSILGTLQMGTTSLASRFMLDVNDFSTAGTAGLNRYYTSTNAASGTVQFGELAYFKNNANATTTIVGSMFRIEDNSTLGNTVRGLEVQTNRGTNTQGENTALSGFARTFGVRGFTSADAGGRFEPAGGYFETGGTTQGNAIRGYSSSLTTANLMSLFQETSAFSGTGLEIDLGNGTGSFTGKFVDMQVAGVSRFNVASTGTMFTQGDVSIVTTNTDPAANNVVGMYFGANGFASINRSGNPAMNLGRSNDGAVLQFYSAGAVQGSVSIAGATVSYNAFTGSHFGLIPSDAATSTYEKGTLLELNGENEYYNDDATSEIVYGMQKTTTENSSRVIGTYLASLEPSQPQSTANPTLVMAVGNGHMWVADQGEDIRAGDFLISSDVAGHAEKENSSSPVSYIIARASEDIDWHEVDAEIDGVKHKRITVFFENFTRPNIDFALIASSSSGLAAMSEGSFTEAFLDGLLAQVARWVGDAQNGIESMYANVFNASERICVDGECLTADNIRDLKNSLPGNGSVPPPTEEGTDGDGGGVDGGSGEDGVGGNTDETGNQGGEVTDNGGEDSVDESGGGADENAGDDSPSGGDTEGSDGQVVI